MTNMYLITFSMSIEGVPCLYATFTMRRIERTKLSLFEKPVVYWEYNLETKELCKIS